MASDSFAFEMNSHSISIIVSYIPETWELAEAPTGRGAYKWTIEENHEPLIVYHH